MFFSVGLVFFRIRYKKNTCRHSRSWVITFEKRPFALGIGAASFFREGGDEAEKDIAESATAEPERPRMKLRNSEPQNLRSFLGVQEFRIYCSGMFVEMLFIASSEKFRVQWFKVQWFNGSKKGTRAITPVPLCPLETLKLL